MVHVRTSICLLSALVLTPVAVGSCAQLDDPVVEVVTSSAALEAPPGGVSIGLLPIAIDEASWNDLLSEPGADDYALTTELEVVEEGSDGILEVSLYPGATGSSGNFGTVDFFDDSNSTADLVDQILNGVVLQDPGLEFNDDGVLYLNGDTGLSIGIKNALMSIVGQPRMVPVFREVSGSGDNAVYTIVKFVGVRIMHVQLTGKRQLRQLVIQPASVVTL